MTTLNERLQAFTKLGSIFKRRNGRRNSAKTNGATTFLTAVVTPKDETDPDIALATYQDSNVGILDSLADDALDLSKDAQSPIADGINITWVTPAINDEFIVTLGSGKGCTKDSLAVIDVDNPGFVESMEPDNESIAQVPPFRILGIFISTKSAVSAKARHAWVRKV